MARARVEVTDETIASSDLSGATNPAVKIEVLFDHGDAYDAIEELTRVYQRVKNQILRTR